MESNGEDFPERPGESAAQVGTNPERVPTETASCTLRSNTSHLVWRDGGLETTLRASFSGENNDSALPRNQSLRHSPRTSSSQRGQSWGTPAEDPQLRSSRSPGPRLGEDMGEHGPGSRNRHGCAGGSMGHREASHRQTDVPGRGRTPGQPAQHVPLSLGQLSLGPGEQPLPSVLCSLLPSRPQSLVPVRKQKANQLPGLIISLQPPPGSGCQGSCQNSASPTP